MKQGKCPRCGSEEVYSGVEVYPKSGPFGSNSIPISIVSMLLHLIIMCARIAVMLKLTSQIPKNSKKSLKSGLR